MRLRVGSARTLRRSRTEVRVGAAIYPYIRIKGRLNNAGCQARITDVLGTLRTFNPSAMNEASKTWKILTEEERSWFTGSVLDIGCGPDKIVPHAKGFDLN